MSSPLILNCGNKSPPHLIHGCVLESLECADLLRGEWGRNGAGDLAQPGLPAGVGTVRNRKASSLVLATNHIYVQLRKPCQGGFEIVF